MEQLKHTLEPKKRASSVQALSGTNLSKTDLRYWKKRVFQPKYTRDGETHKSPHWAVYIQHRGQRHVGVPEGSAGCILAKGDRVVVLCTESLVLTAGPRLDGQGWKSHRLLKDHW